MSSWMQLISYTIVETTYKLLLVGAVMEQSYLARGRCRAKYFRSLLCRLPQITKRYPRD